MLLRYRLITSVAILNAATCFEAELAEYFKRSKDEAKVLASYGNQGKSLAEIKREWFLEQPFTHDVLFHINPKASVLDSQLRRQLLRESKKENAFKDVITFTFLSFFMPRVAVALSGLNFARNLVAETDTEGVVLNTLENLEVGKLSRLIAFIMPLASLF